MGKSSTESMVPRVNFGQCLRLVCTAKRGVEWMTLSFDGYEIVGGVMHSRTQSPSNDSIFPLVSANSLSNQSNSGLGAGSYECDKSIFCHPRIDNCKRALSWTRSDSQVLTYGDRTAPGIMEVLHPLRHSSNMWVFCRTVQDYSGGSFYGAIDDVTNMGLASFNSLPRRMVVQAFGNRPSSNVRLNICFANACFVGSTKAELRKG